MMDMFEVSILPRSSPCTTISNSCSSVMCKGADLQRPGKEALASPAFSIHRMRLYLELYFM
jgi:hypothetical protein